MSVLLYVSDFILEYRAGCRLEVAQSQTSAALLFKINCSQLSSFMEQSG